MKSLVSFITQSLLSKFVELALNMSAKNANYYFSAPTPATTIPGASPSAAETERDVVTYGEATAEAAHLAGSPICLDVAVGNAKSPGKIAVYLKHQPTPAQERKLFQLSNGCRACAERYKEFTCMSGEGCPLLSDRMKIALGTCSNRQAAANFKELCELATEISKQPVDGISIEEGQMVGGHALEEGGYYHLTCNIPKEKQTTVSRTQVALLRKAVQRYGSELMPELVGRLLADGVDEAILSLELMLTCLAAPYGVRFQPTVDWLLRIARVVKEKGTLPKHMTSANKHLFFLKILCLSPILEDNGTAVAPFYHTANHNILDLLKTADSVDGMTKMLTARLSPENYQRPTAAPSLGQIANAEKELGDFSNSVMTQRECIEKYPQAIALSSANNDSKNSSSSAYEQMKEDVLKSSGSKSRGGFATRCGVGPLSMMIKNISSIKELLEFLRKHPDTPIELQTTQMILSYASTSTLDQSRLKHPHLWAFLPGYARNAFGIDGYMRLKIVLPMYEYIHGYKIVLFVPENVKIDRPVGNCCFPEFLTSSYTRTCGTAFERMNTLSKIKIPDEPVMFGVGVSTTDANGKLSHSLMFRIDGELVQIDKL